MVVGAYLLGAFPLLHILGKLRGLSITREDDAHLILWREGGLLAGLGGIVWDIGKGAVPVLVAHALGFSILTAALAGLAVVLGQMWSIFLGFGGEKGNSTGLGMALALAPRALLLALVPILTGALVRTAPRMLDSSQTKRERLKLGGPPSRSLPLGMLIGFAVLPLSAWGWRQPGEVVLVFVALFLAIVVKRLTDGLMADLKVVGDKRSILLNRLLYDRSY
jgi:glycerol-3-phosphate acyltransferase PlsY